jgi:pyroglutamyl-peptidase
MTRRLIPNRTICILVTGFGPFPGAAFNPTQHLVSRLAHTRRPATAGLRLVTHVLPTSYTAVDEQLPALIEAHQPDAIVMFGLAGRTKAIRIEMLARNRITRVFPDIDRKMPQRASIKLGEGTRRGRASFVQLAAAVRASGLPARLSRDAGSYLCNYGYWRALDQPSQPANPRLVAFVHIPNIRSRGRTGGRSQPPSLDQLLRAAQAILITAAAVVRRTDQVRESGPDDTRDGITCHSMMMRRVNSTA